MILKETKEIGKYAKDEINMYKEYFERIFPEREYSIEGEKDEKN